MQINLIVAVCRNNGIGYKGDIPWHIKTDLQYFSKLTKGDGNNAIVMGKNTWNSLPHSLLGRDNLIFSLNQTFNKSVTKDNHLIKTFGSYEEFMSFIKLKSYKEIWIIGGAQIYKTFLDKKIINKCYLTYIDKDFVCDTFLQDLPISEWKEIECIHDYDNKYACTVSYTVYERILT